MQSSVSFHSHFAKSRLHWLVQGHWISKGQPGWDAKSAELLQPESDAASYWTGATLDSSQAPLFKWFVGGLTNAAFNEVDRHCLRSVIGCKSTALIHDMPSAVVQESPQEAGGRVHRCSYASLLKASTAVAAFLANVCDCRVGDRMIMIGPNTLQQAVWINAAKRAAIPYSCASSDTPARVIAERAIALNARIVCIFEGDGQASKRENDNDGLLLTALRRIRKRKGGCSQQEQQPLRVLQIVSKYPCTSKHGSSDVVECSVLLTPLEANSVPQTFSVSFEDAQQGWGIEDRNVDRSDSEVNVEMPVKTSIRVREAAADDGHSRSSGVVPSQLVRRCWSVFAPVAVESNFPLFVAFTSGSTGRPKGLVHATAGLLVGVLETMEAILGSSVSFDNDDDAEGGRCHEGYEQEEKLRTETQVQREGRNERRPSEQDVIFVIATPGWITGQSYMLAGALTTGACSLLMEGSPVAPDRHRWARLIVAHGVTVFKAGSTFLRGVMAAPNAGEALDAILGGVKDGGSEDEIGADDLGASHRAKNTPPKKFKNNRLRIGTFCAEPVAPSVLEFASKHICKRFANSYWGTEHGCMVLSSASALASGRDEPPVLGRTTRVWPLPWISASVANIHVDGPSAAVSANRPGSFCSFEEVGAGVQSDLVLSMTKGPLPSLARTVWGDRSTFEARLTEIRACCQQNHKSPSMSTTNPQETGTIYDDRKNSMSKVSRGWRGDWRTWCSYFAVREMQPQAAPEGEEGSNAPEYVFVQGDTAIGHATHECNELDSQWDRKQYRASSELPVDTCYVGGMSLHGRSDDVMNVAGIRVGTGEIEGAILDWKRRDDDFKRRCSSGGGGGGSSSTFVGIGDVVVCGAPDAIRGECPVAFVCLTTSVASPLACSTISDAAGDLAVPHAAAKHVLPTSMAESIRRFVGISLGPLAVPVAFVAIPAMPETRSGKYLRRLLRRLVEQHLQTAESATGHSDVAFQKNATGESSDGENKYLSSGCSLGDTSGLLNPDSVTAVKLALQAQWPRRPSNACMSTTSSRDASPASSAAACNNLSLPSVAVHRGVAAGSMKEEVLRVVRAMVCDLIGHMSPETLPTEDWLMHLGLSSQQLVLLRDHLEVQLMGPIVAQQQQQRRRRQQRDEKQHHRTAEADSPQAKTVTSNASPLPKALSQLYGVGGLETMSISHIVAHLCSAIALAIVDPDVGCHGATTTCDEDKDREEPPLAAAANTEAAVASVCELLRRVYAAPGSSPHIRRAAAAASIPQPQRASCHRVKATEILERDGRIEDAARAPLRPFGRLDACARGDRECLQRLYGRDARAGNSSFGWPLRHSRCKAGSTAIHWAASGGHVHVLEWLFEHWFDDDTSTTDGQGKREGESDNASSNDRDMCIPFYKLADLRNSSGRTPVMFAAMYGHLAAVKWLVEEGGADIALTSNDGTGIFHYAVYGGNIDLLEYLASALGNSANETEGIAADLGNFHERKRKRKPTGIFATNNFGCDAAHWAAARGSVAVLGWLREHGFDLSSANKNGAEHSPFAKAKYKGHTAAADFLRDL